MEAANCGLDMENDRSPRSLRVFSVPVAPAQQRPGTKEKDLREGSRPHTTDRASLGGPTASCRRTEREPRFSCRRWRRLTGKSSDEEPRQAETAVVARAPPHWSSSMATKGFVAVLPSSNEGLRARQAQSQRDRLARRHIERFDMRVMKQLVDKAYGIKSDPSQQTQGYKELVRNHVYLPSLHRTIDRLDKAKETPAVGGNDRSPPRRSRAQGTPQPPLGSNLLSTQLEVLQAELLSHYERKRREAATAVPELKQARMWSPQRPSSTVVIASPPPGATAPLRMHSKSRSFRMKRHVEPKIVSRIEEPGGSEVESVEAMALTDSDTYSLSSGEGGEQQAVESDVGSGSTCWSSSSLASHVLSTLEGTEATLVGSACDQAVVTYDSEDLALFAETCSERSAANGKDSQESGGSSTTSLISGENSAVEGEHVVFVDNGFRVSSSGHLVQAPTPPMPRDGDSGEAFGDGSHVLFVDNGMRVNTAGTVRAPIEWLDDEMEPEARGESREDDMQGDVLLVDNGVRVNTSGQTKETPQNESEDTSMCTVETTTAKSGEDESLLPARQNEEQGGATDSTTERNRGTPERETQAVSLANSSVRSASATTAQYQADFDELEAELHDYEPFED